MNRSTALTIATFFAAALAWPAPSPAQLIGNFEPQGFSSPATVSLTITDQDGAPVQGASVLVGNAINLPLNGNLLTTNSEGRVDVSQTWLVPEPVTIEAAGFIRATYLELSPHAMTLKIRHQAELEAAPVSRYQLNGDTTGYGPLKNDGIFDIGLVVQAVPRAQLSFINLQTLISPEVDHFTVLGQSVDLPSNIAIPDQTESYIFPLHFNKSTFRLFLPTPGVWQIASLHARLPFKSTIDALQSGKSIVDIVNTFDFREGSVTAVNILSPTQSQDLAVNALPFTKSISFTAPAYDSSMNLLTISLANANGSYYPTDIKNVPPGLSVQLAAPAGAQATGMVLAAFKKAGTKSVGPAADQYTAVILPNNESRPFDPIRLVNAPQVNQNALVLDAPTAGPDLNPVMTYGTLSIVTSITRGKLKIDTKQILWDVWAPNWVNKIDLPPHTLPTIDPSTQSLRWEVGFNAQFVGQKSLPPGPDELEKMTHVSQSAVDL